MNTNEIMVNEGVTEATAKIAKGGFGFSFKKGVVIGAAIIAGV